MTIKNKRFGFTIMELMTVVVILGTIAAYAIPNYSRTIERSYVSDARAQLTAIYAAIQIYHARNGTYWPNTSGDKTIDDINTSLNLNVIASSVMTYTCSSSDSGASNFTCTATRSGGAYDVTVTEATLSDTNPACSGSCP